MSSHELLKTEVAPDYLIRTNSFFYNPLEEMLATLGKVVLPLGQVTDQGSGS